MGLTATGIVSASHRIPFSPIVALSHARLLLLMQRYELFRYDVQSISIFFVTAYFVIISPASKQKKDCRIDNPFLLFANLDADNRNGV